MLQQPVADLRDRIGMGLETLIGGERTGMAGKFRIARR